MNYGGPLTDDARSLLYQIACHMFKTEEKSYSYADEDEEVLVNVRTKFNFACMGTISGTEFNAVVEGQGRTIRTRFLVREFDVQKVPPTARWMRGSPATSPSARAQMN